MRLAGARRIVKSHFCPSDFGFSDGFKFNALIGLGGNVGDTKKIFDRLIWTIKKDRRFHLVEVSPILINAAFGYENQADFSNSVLNLQTNLNARLMLKIMQRYEIKFKRLRSFKNAPRTLDIDILYFSGRNRNDARLTLPHIGASKRLSVIVPIGLMKRV